MALGLCQRAVPLEIGKGSSGIINIIANSLINYFQWQGSQYCKRLLKPSENISSISSLTYTTPLKKGLLCVLVCPQ